MQIERVTEKNKFLSLRDEWNAFVDNCEESCISHTHQWLSCWWDAFAEDASLWVLLLRHEENLVGILPLMLKHERFRGLPVRVLSFMQNGHSPEGGLLLKEPAREALNNFVAYLYVMRNKWDVLRLEKMPQKLVEACNWEELLGLHDFECLPMDSLNSPYTHIEDDWAKYYAARSKKFRKVMRNKLNRMNKDGLLQFERLSGPQISTESLEEMFQVSKRSWKGQENKSILDDSHVEQFYRNITAVFAPEGRVDLWSLRRNGKAVAFEYHLKHSGVTYPIRADFDETYHALSPGSLLEFFIMKKLFEDPAIRGANSCGATYHYLMNWATAVIDRVGFLIFNSRKYSRNLYLLESKVLPVARRAKTIVTKRSERDENEPVQGDLRMVDSGDGG